jgi:nicotinamidase/pyrazinamidase
MAADRDAYSGFEGTDLNQRLKDAGIRRLLIGGLATDYCVLNTVKDAVKNGFNVLLLQDAIRAVNVRTQDGEKAVEEMVRLGAVPIEFDWIA